MNYIIHMGNKPSYMELFQKGILKTKIKEIKKIIKDCCLCPHNCHANRLNSEKGYCNTGKYPIVASYAPHFGEEVPLVGTRGSGTIFFSNCNLKCVFCQNYDISQSGIGHEISYSDLALMMISLQNEGCHNINFVSPTHMIYPILKALEIAIKMGLHIPLVYNSGGYDSVKTLKILNGIFDIYMPDFKYADSEIALKLSRIKNYTEIVKKAIIEMFEQVGDLFINSKRIAIKGLLVRHLVLPYNTGNTYKIIDYISSFSKNSYLNLMNQYHPEYLAKNYPEISRRTTLEEFDKAVLYACEKKLNRIIF